MTIAGLCLLAALSWKLGRGRRCRCAPCEELIVMSPGQSVIYGIRA